MSDLSPAPSSRSASVLRRALTSVLPLCLAATAGLVVLASPSGTGPGARAPLQPVAETYPLGTASTVTLTGRGFGHGRGMSQWGAYGAASQGVPWTQIVDHYYPGTTRTQIGNPLIRVDVRSDLGRMAFAAASGLVATYGTDHGSATTLPLKGSDGTAVAAFVVSPASSTTARIVYVTAAGHVGTVGPTSSQVNVRNTLTGSVTAWGSVSGRVGTIRGEFRGVMSSGAVVPVAAIPLDEYLRGVVPHESPASWPAGALQAQSVAARSYAAYSIAHPRASGWDICDSTSCQVFQARGYYASSDAAVTSTAGIALRYAGQPAFTEFSASSGGWQAAGSVPYLVPQADPWDGTTANPNRSWSVEISPATFSRIWPAIGTYRGIQVLSRDGQGTWGGRVTSLALYGTSGSVTISGASLQATFGLKSTFLTVLPTTSPSSFPRDYTGDALADLRWIAPDATGGRLMLSRGDGRGNLAAPVAESTRGWSWVRKVVSAGTWDGDAVSDVLTIDSAGTMSFWSGAALSSGGRVIATGMGQYDLVFPVGDFDGDGYSDLLARRLSDGVLVRIGTDGRGGIRGTPAVSSLSMRAFDSIFGVGDFDGDGHVDIAAHGSAGLTLFSGNGKGSWLRSSHIGSGWESARTWLSAGDLTGDGKSDVVAVLSDGHVALFSGNRTGFSSYRYIATMPVGTIWLQ